MDINTITELLTAILPSVASIISMIATIMITIKKFKESLGKTEDVIEEQRRMNLELMKENRELKKVIKTKIDKIGD